MVFLPPLFAGIRAQQRELIRFVEILERSIEGVRIQSVNFTGNTSPLNVLPMKPGTHHHPTILIIDHDEDDCSIFREVIAEVSPRTETVIQQDAGRLMEVIERTKPTLIFIEYNLCRENGIEWVRRLKAHPVFRSIPVVMWSTSRLLSVAAAAFTAGVQNFHEKPWEVNVWVQKIKKVLQQNRIELSSLAGFLPENDSFSPYGPAC